jgi:octaprenyl-diphosphate synthase
MRVIVAIVRRSSAFRWDDLPNHPAFSPRYAQRLSHNEMDSTSAIRPRLIDTQNSTGDHQNGLGRTSSPAQAILQSFYGPVADRLTQVEKRLSQELQSNHDSLSAVLRHGSQLGGKRLRPAMLLLAGQATGTLTDDHVVLATVVEMVHTATLIHDDVLDEAAERRHVDTINEKWNEHTSILVGDYLFAQSFYLAATLPSTEACRWIGNAARLVCEGELRQVLQRDSLDLDEMTYIELIRGKTAELCRVSTQLGARFAGASESVVQSLGTFGDSLGIAFQIADDYLDLWGEEKVVGKTLGTDISQGKMTLPIIRLLQTAKPDARSKVIQILAGPARDRLAAIRPFLDDSDAREHTRKIAECYRDKAIKSLDPLNDSPAFASLRAMSQFSVDRRF